MSFPQGDLSHIIIGQDPLYMFTELFTSLSVYCILICSGYYLRVKSLSSQQNYKLQKGSMIKNSLVLTIVNNNNCTQK